MWYFYVLFLLQSLITTPIVIIGFVVSLIYFFKNKNYKGPYYFSNIWKSLLIIILTHNIFYFVTNFTTRYIFSTVGNISSHRHPEVFFLTDLFEFLTLPILFVGVVITIIALFKRSNILITYGLSILLPVLASVFSGAMGFMVGFGNTQVEPIFMLVAMFLPISAYVFLFIFSVFILFKSKAITNENIKISNYFNGDTPDLKIEKYFLSRGLNKNQMSLVKEYHQTGIFPDELKKSSVVKKSISLILILLLLAFVAVSAKTFYDIYQSKNKIETINRVNVRNSTPEVDSQLDDQTSVPNNKEPTEDIIPNTPSLNFTENTIQDCNKSYPGDFVNLDKCINHVIEQVYESQRAFNMKVYNFCGSEYQIQVKSFDRIKDIAEQYAELANSEKGGLFCREFGNVLEDSAVGISIGNFFDSPHESSYKKVKFYKLFNRDIVFQPHSGFDTRLDLMESQIGYNSEELAKPLPGGGYTIPFIVLGSF